MLALCEALRTGPGTHKLLWDACCQACLLAFKSLDTVYNRIVVFIVSLFFYFFFFFFFLASLQHISSQAGEWTGFLGLQRHHWFHCATVGTPMIVLFSPLGPHPQHMEVTRLGVKLELQLQAYTTVTATPDPSCVYDIHRSSLQSQILNPLSRARDRTSVLKDTSWVHYHWATMGTPPMIDFLKTFFLIVQKIVYVQNLLFLALSYWRTGTSFGLSSKAPKLEAQMKTRANKSHEIVLLTSFPGLLLQSNSTHRMHGLNRDFFSYNAGTACLRSRCWWMDVYLHVCAYTHNSTQRVCCLYILWQTCKYV